MFDKTPGFAIRLLSDEPTDLEERVRQLEDENIEIRRAMEETERVLKRVLDSLTTLETQTLPRVAEQLSEIAATLTNYREE